MDYQQPKQFEEIIDMPLLTEVFKHQRVLDAEFLKVANRMPSPEDRVDAAIDEAAEFIAEFKTINKYWTDKGTDLNQVLDEHSDIIHFLVGYQIAVGNSSKQTFYRLKHYYENILRDYDSTDKGHVFYWQKVQYFLRLIRRTDSIFEQLAAATIVIGMAGFTKEDVLKQYRIKRDENYKRIALTAEGLEDR